MTVQINIDDLKQNYLELKSIRKVAKNFNISTETVRCKLKNLGVLNKPLIRYTCNDNLFSQDTPESFYWAGFIAADGCIKLHSKKYKYLSIGLAIEDQNHLEKFKKIIEFNGPILRKKDSDGNESVEIAIRSDKIFDDLQRFKITERKSLTLKFPEFVINHEHCVHFLRGYFDGGGSFYEENPKNGRGIKQIYFSTRGTKEFLTIFKSIFEDKLGFDKNPNKPRLNSDIYALEYGGNGKVGKIAKYLYQNSTENLRLDRKFEFAKKYELPENYDPQTNKYKKIEAKNIITDEIKIFKSIKEAASFIPNNKVSSNRVAISNCCRDKKQQYAGYTWKYA